MRASVGAGKKVGADVTGRLLDSVGDAEIALGNLLDAKLGAVGPGDTFGIIDIVGIAPYVGSDVELATGIVGIRNTLGC